MSQQMTITRVMEGDQWGNEYGQNQSYTLDLQLEDGTVVQDIVSNRKIKDDGSHKEPQEQEVVWGDLLPMAKGQRKLKLDYDAMKEHGSSPRSYEATTGTSGGSNNSSKAQSKDVDWDARNAEIRRQHSQEMALRFADLGIGEEAPTIAGILQWADYFDQDAIAAGQKASQGAATASASPHSLSPPSAAPDSLPATALATELANRPDFQGNEQPVDLSGARTEEPKPPPSLNFPKGDLPTVDRDHIMQLLGSAGLTFAAAQEKVTDYICGPLLVSGREKAALSGLQDLDRQGTVLAQLKVETEKWIGSPLPQGDALDGSDNVPF